jgi:hypothetical protein
MDRVTSLVRKPNSETDIKDTLNVWHTLCTGCIYINGRMLAQKHVFQDAVKNK